MTPVPWIHNQNQIHSSGALKIQFLFGSSCQASPLSLTEDDSHLHSFPMENLSIVVTHFPWDKKSKLMVKKKSDQSYVLVLQLVVQANDCTFPQTWGFTAKPFPSWTCCIALQVSHLQAPIA